jgi:SAM-dependent methyltransferase
VSRSLRALSSAYVERRSTIAGGAALSGRGKRAAFALFYGPLHFLLVDHIVGSLPPRARTMRALLDLGCGTGAAGAAWASACERPPAVIGIDRNTWALGEAAATYRAFGLSGRTRQEDVAALKLPTDPTAFLAAFTLNEMEDHARDALLERVLDRIARGRGDQVLIVEPVAGSVAPWWNKWRDRFESTGGRSDEWRVQIDLPAIVAKLDRATGLNHREITGRSLWSG